MTLVDLMLPQIMIQGYCVLKIDFETTYPNVWTYFNRQLEDIKALPEHLAFMKKAFAS